MSALTFNDVKQSSNVDWASISELARRAPSVLRELLAESQIQAPAQAAFHGFWVAFLRECRGIIAQHCDLLPVPARIEAIAEITGHVVETSAQELQLCHGEAWSRALERLSRRARTIAEQIETIVNLPGLLTTATDVTNTPANDLHLEYTFEGDAKDNAFGLLLRQVRGNLTQHELARRFRKLGLKQLAVSNWENGVYVPARRQAHLVQAIANHFSCPQLFAEYGRARDRLEAENLFARRRDINFRTFLAGHEREFRAFVRYSTTRLGVPRRGKLFSKGCFAGNTLESYRREISHALAAVRLPKNPDNPRTSGLGWKKNIGFVSLILPDALDANLALRVNRRGAGRDGIANADSVAFALLRSWVSQPDGWLWQNAETVAELNPGAVSRLATHWPQNSFFHAGKRCASDADRIRAQCLISTPLLTKLVKAAASAPCRPQHHASLGPVIAKLSLPLAGVFAVLDRINLEGELKTEEKWNEALVVSYLARSAYRPPRINDGLALELHSLTPRDDEFLLYVTRPEKNSGSLMACTEYLGVIPRELNRYLRPFDRARRSRGFSDGPYCITADGSPLTAERLRYLLEKIMRTYGGDIFPQGARTHSMRYLVATSLCVFAGKEIGTALAAVALRDSTMTIGEKYILIKLEDDYVPPFSVRHLTHGEMLRLARKQARDFKSDFVVDIPAVRRRSAHSIGQAKTRHQNAQHHEAA